MKIEEQRLRNKLALWDTPGFSQFIIDLAGAVGPIIDIEKQVETRRLIYKGMLQDIIDDSSKFKQTKLPL